MNNLDQMTIDDYFDEYSHFHVKGRQTPIQPSQLPIAFWICPRGSQEVGRSVRTVLCGVENAAFFRLLASAYIRASDWRVSRRLFENHQSDIAASVSVTVPAHREAIAVRIDSENTITACRFFNSTTSRDKNDKTMDQIIAEASGIPMRFSSTLSSGWK